MSIQTRYNDPTCLSKGPEDMWWYNRGLERTGVVLDAARTGLIVPERTDEYSILLVATRKENLLLPDENHKFNHGVYDALNIRALPEVYSAIGALGLSHDVRLSDVRIFNDEGNSGYTQHEMDRLSSVFPYAIRLELIPTQQ